MASRLIDPENVLSPLNSWSASSTADPDRMSNPAPERSHISRRNLSKYVKNGPSSGSSLNLLGMFCGGGSTLTWAIAKTHISRPGENSERCRVRIRQLVDSENGLPLIEQHYLPQVVSTGT